MKKNRDLIDLSTMFTDAFYKNKDHKKGSVLIFDNAGEKTELKIVKLNRSAKTCWAEHIKLYSEDEINDMERSAAEEIIKHGKGKDK